MDTTYLLLLLLVSNVITAWVVGTLVWLSYSSYCNMLESTLDWYKLCYDVELKQSNRLRCKLKELEEKIKYELQGGEIV